ncbi:glycosyltransferase family 2 protein [Desulfopila sp. IMCC35006]|uniref:glycosyltransferase family 2 protein n=1 Tax=Desulfopila sp. IMCC35006 TaxID=2569542 RepID=UPI0010AD85D5|nr:glycosyltransferase family A protein [Desulfopila sp. IMCC35006]TKB23218.1 glycosyltransferase family 2 protein [Desulfopila sp. IMCC35006]
MKTYVLITPVRNEEEYIGQLIDSVLRQSILPMKWVIVSDGSTDDTERIVILKTKQHPFVQLVRLEKKSKRSFGSKALAFRKGYNVVQNLDYDYIGNLDGDVTFETNYYERMIEEMGRNPQLGVASGVCLDKTDYGFKRTLSSLNHAVGAVQFWRRSCFEAIEGYQPTTVGGVDSLAELNARMRGWETRSFADLPVYHHKPVDTANARTGIHIAYRAGMTEYHIGTYPLFAVLKAFRRWQQSPRIISAFIRLFAYGKLWVTRAPRDATVELESYLKKEQLASIKRVLQGKIKAIFP